MASVGGRQATARIQSMQSCALAARLLHCLIADTAYYHRGDCAFDCGRLRRLLLSWLVPGAVGSASFMAMVRQLEARWSHAGHNASLHENDAQETTRTLSAQTGSRHFDIMNFFISLSTVRAPIVSCSTYLRRGRGEACATWWSRGCTLSFYARASRTSRGRPRASRAPSSPPPTWRPPRRPRGCACGRAPAWSR